MAIFTPVAAASSFAMSRGAMNGTTLDTPNFYDQGQKVVLEPSLLWKTLPCTDARMSGIASLNKSMEAFTCVLVVCDVLRDAARDASHVKQASETIFGLDHTRCDACIFRHKWINE